jgi:site-specific recombinase XerD
MINRFLAELADEGRSAFTLRTYRQAVLLWQRHVTDPPGTPEEVRSYLRQFAAASSRRTYLAALRRWYRFLIDQGTATVDPTVGIRTGRPPERAPRVITPEEEQALFAATHRIDERALLRLLRFSGLRVGEAVGYRRWIYDPYRKSHVKELVLGLRIGDVNLVARIITVRGKGGRVDLAYLDSQTAELIGKLVEGLSHRLPAAPIFQREDGTPLECVGRMPPSVGWRSAPRLHVRLRRT